MARSKALREALPRQSPMTVMGSSISREEAADLLLRTNNWHWGEVCTWEAIEMWSALGIPCGYGKAPDRDSLREFLDRVHALNLQYICNHRLLAGTPNGWCDWQGYIHTTSGLVYWGETEAVREEWTEVADAFPFLDLRCQLWDEAGNKPLIEFTVRGGKVRTSTPRSPLLKPTSLTTLLAPHAREIVGPEAIRQAVQVLLDRQPRPTIWNRLLSNSE